MKEADARPSDQGEHGGMLTAFEGHYLSGVECFLQKKSGVTEPNPFCCSLSQWLITFIIKTMVLIYN